VNDTEGARLFAYLDASYPSAFGSMDAQRAQAMVEIWTHEFRDKTLDEVIAAVRHCDASRIDVAFPPSLPMVRKALDERRAPDQVPLDDALVLFRYALGCERRDGRDAAMRWLAAESEQVALFVRDVGWETLRRENIDDDRYGGAVRNRLQQALDGAHHDLVHEREIARPRLERHTQPRSRRVLPAGEDGTIPLQLKRMEQPLPKLPAPQPDPDPDDVTDWPDERLEAVARDPLVVREQPHVVAKVKAELMRRSKDAAIPY
jgi:Loader and inhibitor of phage G40P